MRHRQALYAWYWAIRPFSLSASIVPVLVGAALASQYSPPNGWLLLLILLGSLLVQSATNLVDEYADHQQHTSSSAQILPPYKVIARGQLSAAQVFNGAVICFVLAALIGVYLVLRTGWPLVAVCLASLGVAYGYSAGPKPLGNMALGELMVFIFMGPVMVVSTFYVLTQRVNGTVLLVSLPVACLVTAILVVNNLRDTEEDRLNGKKTLVTLCGRRPAVWLYDTLLVIAFGSVVAYVLSGMGSWIWLAPLLVLPRGVKIAKMVQSGSERARLHRAMQGTATLHLQFGLLLALALMSLTVASGG